MIGKYERVETVPSIDAAKKIADTLKVSLDYWVGEGINARFNKNHSSAWKNFNYSKVRRKDTIYSRC